jgi:hypothetical protein
MVDAAILVGSFLLTALFFLVIGFYMGRKTYIAPEKKEKVEKTKETAPFVEDINQSDPYALAQTEEPGVRVVSDM